MCAGRAPLKNVGSHSGLACLAPVKNMYAMQGQTATRQAWFSASGCAKTNSEGWGLAAQAGGARA